MAQVSSLKRFLSAILAVLLLSACAGRIDKERSAKPPPAPEPGKAVLVMMYPGPGSLASVFSGPPNGDEFDHFIGVVAPGSKFAAQIDPGEYRIMIASRAMDFMEAEFAAGKTYYALISPLVVSVNYGNIIPEITLKPVPKGFHKGQAFRSWYEATLWKESSEGAQSSADSEAVEGSEAWARETWKRVFEKQDLYLESWYARPARPRLRAKDGV